MSKKILIAEDDDAMRSMLVDYLETAGYDVTESDNGETAWELWNRDIFDILISDINMPRLNGVELLRKVKEVNETFPVIIITGAAQEIAKAETSRYGADAFLIKPFKMKILFDTIKEIFDVDEI